MMPCVTIARAVAAPDLAQRLRRQDNVPQVMNPGDFARLIRRESALNAKIIADAGIKPE